jgi:manganese/iron transport system permease protein
MRNLLFEPFQQGFMRRALFEVVLLGVLGGVVGVHVLLRRLAFLTEVVQHTVFPGIAIAFAADQSLLVGAVLSGLVSIVLFTLATRQPRLDPDSVMAVLIATFLSLGVVVVSRGTGFQSDLNALLFGRILTVGEREVIETAIIAIAVVGALILLHKELVMRAFDPTGSAALGYSPFVLDFVVNLSVMLTIVAAVRAVGTVLVVAFIVTPAAAGRLVSTRVPVMMVLAAGLAALCGWLGLVVSYEGSVNHGWRLASGATIVLTITAGFVVVAVVQAARHLVVGRRAKAAV